MTIATVNLANLKKVKNSVIGNPSAKLQLARDDFFIRKLIECINYPSPPSVHEPQGSQDDIRIEAAHVISSIAYGSEEALSALLRCNAPHELLYAISHFQLQDPIPLRAAFARALRALAVAISDVVGPSQWGIKPENALSTRHEATEALEYLFQIDSLDIYLPLLIDTSPQTSTSIAQLLASTLRTPEHRKAISGWLPPAERMKEVKARRGWEKASMTMNQNWVARNLTGLLRSRDIKLQEAALSALAALAKENLAVAGPLAKPMPDRELPSPLQTVISLSKSRSPDVQLAACLCATNIIRALPASNSHNHPTHTHPSAVPPDDTCARTVMNIVNRMISLSTPESPTHRTRACFILYNLVTDDPALCQAAFERGCLSKLIALVGSLSTPDTTEDADEDSIEEPEATSCLREAALTAIAAISLFDNDIRRFLTSPSCLTSTAPSPTPPYPTLMRPSLSPSPSPSPYTSASTTITVDSNQGQGQTPFLPLLMHALSHKHTGTRYAACQCVRALSRAVAVLRTSVVDSGLGMKVFWIVMGTGGDGKGTTREGVAKGEKEKEDRRVLGAALAAVCNLVNEFSPLRQTLLDEGLMPRLVQILDVEGVGEPALRISALWAVKNLLCKTETETKQEVMECLGWDRLLRLLEDPDEGVQEQALNIIRNLAENEDGIDMVFREMGTAVLLDRIVGALKSSDEDVVLQAAYVLANLSNGQETHQSHILTYPYMLETMHTTLVNSKTDIRRPIVSCIVQLARTSRGIDTDSSDGSTSTNTSVISSSNTIPSPIAAESNVRGTETTQVLRRVFESTLRHMCDWAGGGGGAGALRGSPGARMGPGVGMGMGAGVGIASVIEDDRDVVDQARIALHWLEHGDGL